MTRNAVCIKTLHDVKERPAGQVLGIYAIDNGGLVRLGDRFALIALVAPPSESVRVTARSLPGGPASREPVADGPALAATVLVVAITHLCRRGDRRER